MAAPVAAQPVQLLPPVQPPVAVAPVASPKKNPDARNVFIGTTSFIVCCSALAAKRYLKQDSREEGIAVTVAAVSTLGAVFFAGGVVCRGISDGYNKCMKKLKTPIKPLKGDCCFYSAVGGAAGGFLALMSGWPMAAPIAGGALALNLFGCFSGMSWVNPESDKQKST